MIQEAVKHSYRGVRCLSCLQPIPLPGILLRMDQSLREAGAVQEHPTRVFSLRCRACEKEKPYRANDIVEFEGEPRARVSHSRVLHAHGRRSAGLSRAASS
jgi:hypothetical protein